MTGNDKLQIGQVLKIQEDSYTVKSLIEFQEENWIWTEYELFCFQMQKTIWLCAEEDELTIYEMYHGGYVRPESQINVDGEAFHKVEDGRAVVRRYAGTEDIDLGEVVKYVEYKSETSSRLCSIESWSDGNEISFGKTVNPSHITIESKANQSNANQSNVSGNNYYSGNRYTSESSAIDPYTLNRLKDKAIIILVLIGIMIGAGAIVGRGVSANSSLKKAIEKSSVFTYVTSVTNNETKKIAKVYSSEMDVDTTVQTIIKLAPESVDTVSESDENDISLGVSILADRVYVFVYEGEEGTTLFQVSDSKYINESSTVYNPRNRMVHNYYRGFFSSGRTTSRRFYDTLTSAKQESVRSRSSSGGGISSGK